MQMQQHQQQMPAGQMAAAGVAGGAGNQADKKSGKKMMNKSLAVNKAGEQQGGGASQVCAQGNSATGPGQTMQEGGAPLNSNDAFDKALRTKGLHGQIGKPQTRSQVNALNLELG